MRVIFRTSEPFCACVGVCACHKVPLLKGPGEWNNLILLKINFHILVRTLTIQESSYLKTKFIFPFPLRFADIISFQSRKTTA